MPCSSFVIVCWLKTILKKSFNLASKKNREQYALQTVRNRTPSKKVNLLLCWHEINTRIKMSEISVARVTLDIAWRREIVTNTGRMCLICMRFCSAFFFLNHCCFILFIVANVKQFHYECLSSASYRNSLMRHALVAWHIFIAMNQNPSIMSDNRP